MATLIGADLQKLGRDDPVEPRPVKTRIGMVDLTGKCRHKGDGILLTLGQCGDGGAQVGVVHTVTLGGAVQRSDPFDRDGRAFATADTDCRDPTLEFMTLQGVEQRDHNPRTRGPDRMSQGTGPAM